MIATKLHEILYFSAGSAVPSPVSHGVPMLCWILRLWSVCSSVCSNVNKLIYLIVYCLTWSDNGVASACAVKLGHPICTHTDTMHRRYTRFANNNNSATSIVRPRTVLKRFVGIYCWDYNFPYRIQRPLNWIALFLCSSRCRCSCAQNGILSFQLSAAAVPNSSDQ